MKRDKARLLLGSRTLLGHVQALARGLGCGVRLIRRDLIPRCGPLGGVCTALRTTNARQVLFLACDMPFVTVALLRQVGRTLRSGAPAAFVHCRGVAGFPFALRPAMLPVVEALLAERQVSLQRLARRLRARRVTLRRAEADQLFNINTPSDWARARAYWRRKRRLSAVGTNGMVVTC
ncbi:MAG: NTP transferase domain-containing protein [Verrucomicrobia bacterium]|nr:NTP transferase domain-containing protein [Verrucomicrobiota bacterium]